MIIGPDPESIPEHVEILEQAENLYNALKACLISRNYLGEDILQGESYDAREEE